MYAYRPFIVKNVGRAFQSVLNLSGDANKLINLSVDDDGIAVMTLQRPSVNSLNLEMIENIISALDEVANNKYKGMILTSAMPTVFMAGLDIFEMYNPDLKRAKMFWHAAQEVWLKLFGAKYVTAAAINGHSPGAGCLLSLACEYRAMVDGKFKIGLNEAAVGVIAHPWTMDTLLHAVPRRQAELALTAAKMFTVEEALQVGIIDEIVKDKQEAIDKCKKFIKQFDNISPMARAYTKQKLREGPIKKMLENRQEDMDLFLDLLRNPTVQANLEVYIKQRKLKSNNKAQ